MGTKLTGQGIKPTPVVAIKKTPDTFFKGVLRDMGTERRLKKGMATVFTFELDSTDMDLHIKNPATGKYDDLKEVAQGDVVSVFAPTVLKAALLRGKVGAMTTIKFLGMKENYYNYDVEQD